MNRYRLAVRIVSRFVLVSRLLAKLSLPEVVDALSSREVRHRKEDPGRIRYGIDRLLMRPGFRFRCLPRALVMFTLLVEQGDRPRLLIGLPLEPASTETHAWIELDGHDVGPSPGKSGHEAIASYPVADT